MRTSFNALSTFGPYSTGDPPSWRASAFYAEHDIEFRPVRSDVVEGAAVGQPVRLQRVESRPVSDHAALARARSLRQACVNGGGVHGPHLRGVQPPA